MGCGQIVFMTSNEFMDYAATFPAGLKIATVFIDEFDSILFEDESRAKKDVTTLAQVPKLYALSGSEFGVDHLFYVNTHCRGTLFNFTLPTKEKPERKCCRVAVFNTLDKWRRAILDSCKEFSKKCPTLVITDEDKDALAKKFKNKLQVDRIDIQSPEDVIDTLKYFLV
jgi:hypothetical protein